MKNIFCKKEEATAQYIIPIMALMIVSLIILFKIQMSVATETKIKVEDSLTDANMASAIIDNVDRATTHYVGNRYIEDDPDYIIDLYNIYKNCLVAELNLEDGDSMTPINNTLIVGSVDILEYSIYNYYDDHIARISYYPASGEIITSLDLPITIKTPNDKAITSYTVYSKIGFHVRNVGFSEWGNWLTHNGSLAKDELKSIDSPAYVTKDNSVGIYKNSLDK